MSLDAPTITATCAACGHKSDPMELWNWISAKRWDARHIPAKLARMGWAQNGENWYCPECAEAMLPKREVEAAR